jgi:hypothetical protein
MRIRKQATQPNFFACSLSFCLAKLSPKEAAVNPGGATLTCPSVHSDKILAERKASCSSNRSRWAVEYTAFRFAENWFSVLDYIKIGPLCLD